ncbi:hypothetical protein GUJ93_ZPchr0050g33546 [Zizania palustris]|uniref:Uncharacterized protein n=1 Tax=Zizania palustris TaxID=103762 RepID=A0A8J5V092_ZIZPA|nr:hypothetical protein GUJ93_ZPchr0050g33546 [Zizania palustris]
MDNTVDGPPILAKKAPPPALLGNIFGDAELQQWKHMDVRRVVQAPQDHERFRSHWHCTRQQWRDVQEQELIE